MCDDLSDRRLASRLIDHIGARVAADLIPGQRPGLPGPAPGRPDIAALGTQRQRSPVSRS